MASKFKKNKFFILAIVLMGILTLSSFYQFYDEYFSYAPEYYKIKENCYKKKNPDAECCKYFIDNKYQTGEKQLELYIKINDPKKIYKTYNAIHLTGTVVQHTRFSCVQFFSPLIIAIAVLGTIHSEFSSGMFENYLLRMDYKKYLKRTYKIALKAALITPLTLIIIFVLSSIFTGFNFDMSQVNQSASVYSEFKYNHFLLYGTIICLTQFFISLLYANIALYCCKKNRNKLVAIIMSYLLFLLVDLFIYIIIYIVIINKMFGFKNLTDYFNITGYWYFKNSDCYIALIVSFFLQLVSLFILFHSYRKKEGTINAYEKQIP